MEIHEVVTSNSTVYVLFVQYTAFRYCVISKTKDHHALLKVTPVYSHHAWSANPKNVNSFGTLESVVSLMDDANALVFMSGSQRRAGSLKQNQLLTSMNFGVRSLALR